MSLLMMFGSQSGTVVVEGRTGCPVGEAVSCGAVTLSVQAPRMSVPMIRRRSADATRER